MPSFDDVVARIEQEQSRRSLMNPHQSETTENQAFKTYHNHNPNPRGPTRLKGAATSAWCDHYKRAGHNREGCWVLHPHLRPVRNKGGRVGGGKQEPFSGLSKGPDHINDGTEASGMKTESTKYLGADSSGSSVVSTAQLANLMTHLSSLLQQHVAGSSKPSISHTNFRDLLKLLQNCAPKFANICQYKSNWVVDSGATDHMTCNPIKLQNFTKLKEPQYVTVANGNKTQILGTGTTNLLTKNVKDVLYTS
jgi:hypothetical protein